MQQCERQGRQAGRIHWQRRLRTCLGKLQASSRGFAQPFVRIQQLDIRFKGGFETALAILDLLPNSWPFRFEAFVLGSCLLSVLVVSYVREICTAEGFNTWYFTVCHYTPCSLASNPFPGPPPGIFLPALETILECFFCRPCLLCTSLVLISWTAVWSLLPGLLDFRALVPWINQKVSIGPHTHSSPSHIPPSTCPSVLSIRFVQTGTCVLANTS